MQEVVERFLLDGIEQAPVQVARTVGAGLEYAFLGNWSAKIEYLYVNLGKFNCVACSGALTDNVSFKENIVRAGLNYRF